jgi:hypothetical protein
MLFVNGLAGMRRLRGDVSPLCGVLLVKSCCAARPDPASLLDCSSAQEAVEIAASQHDAENNRDKRKPNEQRPCSSLGLRAIRFRH